MEFEHLAVGVCGLSCRLCPRFHTDGSSRCGGCKSPFRMGAGCPFITCAVKKKGIELCTDCVEGETCERWKRHRELSKTVDSFVCYQKLEDNIRSIKRHGIEAFEETQEKRCKLLEEMMAEFDDGRSKSFYCVAATLMEPEELEGAIAFAGASSTGKALKEKAKVMHKVLEDIAREKGYHLALRK
ncbi:MAG TPA: hypothetical protein VGJ92_08590 [Methanocella sp.]|jgi:hypothetical protein